MASTRSDQKIPSSIVLAVVIVSILPFMLNLMGVDFGSTSKPLPTGDSENIVIDDLFYRLSGAFTHTILEWTAFSAAIFTVFLAFAHYRIVKDITTPVIGVALLCAGCMDAFHTLAAARLIEAVAENTNLIPFTWAISRTFNALIMIIGVSIFLVRPRSEVKAGLPFVLGISLMFGLLAYAIIHYCATSAQLPQTMYPDSLITRPWDVGPLLLFLFAGLYVFPKFYKSHPSIFAHSLIICAIPEVAVEFYMAFGSTALFDNHFNIAHFLKIIAYMVPLAGLTMDYVQTYLSKEADSRESERLKNRFQQVFNNSPNALIIVDEHGEIIISNSRTAVMFAYENDELIGKRIEELIPERFRSHHPEQRQGYMSDMSPRSMGVGRDLYGLRKDGTEFPIEIGLNHVESESESESESLVLSTITDITERMKLQEKITDSEKDLKSFLNGAPVMMWMTDAEGKGVLFNDTWLTFFGHTLEDELLHDWDGENIHPDDKQNCMENYNNAVSNHVKIQHEYKIKNIDGEYYWISEVAVPRFNSKHEYEGHIGTCVDITNMKMAEEGLIQRTTELERSNKELEQFAYVASHDLQEPLRMVASYTNLLALRYKDKLDDDANDFIDFATDGAKRMQLLINDLLAISRINAQSIKFTRIDCNSLCQDVFDILHMSIDEANMTVSKDDLPEIMGDEQQLRQLFQNLISNAIKYSDPERKNKVHISASKDNRQWIFSVSDNGIGIAPEYFEKIFVIFKRLHGKEAYSGTGIGLSICKKIVERHGGKIWVESVPGQGSTFSFSFPSN